MCTDWRSSPRCWPRRGSSSTARPSDAADASSRTGGDLRLQPKDVTVAHTDIAQRLLIEELLSRGAVMKLVAEQLPVRRVLREVHPIEKHRENALDRGVVGHFDVLPLVARRIPHLNRQHPHDKTSPAVIPEPESLDFLKNRTAVPLIGALDLPPT